MLLKKRYTHFLVFFLCFSLSQAISCRSEHTSKENELKRVYNNCLTQVQGNPNDNRGGSNGEWSDPYDQRNQWQRDIRNENRENSDRDRRTDWNRDDNNMNERNGHNKNYMKDDQYNSKDSKQNRMSGRNEKTGNVNGGDMGGRGRGRDDMNNYGRTDHLSGQDGFLESEEYGTDASHHNYYPSQSQSQYPRRFKREKRNEMNTGQRSQYNPHSQHTNDRDDRYTSDKNASDNSSREVDRACVLHCFLENLHMTGDTGMPDRYLVTHSLIKDEKNEDLRDFLQESIEECFQILDNENTEDKCEFSKNLLTCLAEKGRANCDDWTGKTSFLFEQ